MSFRQVDDGSLSIAKQRAQTQFAYPFGNYVTPDNFSRTINRPMAIRPRNFARITSRRTTWRNLVIQSNTLNAGVWTATRLTPESNATRTPNNLVAWRLREDNSSDTHLIEQSGIAIVAGKVVRYVIAKAGERNRLNLAMIGDVSVAQGFDLETGELYNNGLGMDAPEQAIIFPIEDADGWWFLGMKQTFASGLLIQTYLDDGSGINYPGDDTSGLYVACDHVLNGDRFGPIFQTEGEARSISAPDLDPGDSLHQPDPYAFLLEETNPNPDPVGRYIWDRVFGRVPNQQTMPGTLQIPKPELPGTGPLPRIVGDYFLRQQFIEGIWDAYFRIQTSGDSGIPSYFPTGGTYTVTFDGDTTTPLAFDADAPTVETALNALASVIARGGVTVTGAYNDPDGFEIVFADYATGTVDDSGLTVGGSGVSLLTTVTPLNGGYLQNVGILARQDNGFPIGTSSFGPAGANPMTVLVQSTSRVTIALGDSITNLVAATSGDFTFTWFGDTTAAIPWNANASDIETAINLLAGVAARGGCTVTFVGLVNSVPTFSIRLPDPEITGGDFTVELFGDTSAPIAWNANAATIQTALNLLAGVTARGGCTVNTLSADPVAPTSIKFSITFGNPLVTGDVSALTPAGSLFTPTTGDGGINQTQNYEIGGIGIRILNIPGHSISTGQECFIPVPEEQGYVIEGFRVTRLDENTVSYIVRASDPDASFPDVIEFDPLTKRGYKPGTASIACQRVTDYYLPGVTIGIASVADIPFAPSQSDTPTFLQLVFAGVGEINWQVGESAQWKGPIVSASKTTIRAADV